MHTALRNLFCPALNHAFMLQTQRVIMTNAALAVLLPANFRCPAGCSALAVSATIMSGDDAAVRREMAARAAERRIIENAKKIAAQRAPFSMLSTLDRGGLCETSSSADTSTAQVKRKASDASQETDKNTQVSLSNSDDDDVTCLGVTANTGGSDKGYTEHTKLGEIAGKGAVGNIGQEGGRARKRLRKETKELNEKKLVVPGALMGTGTSTSTTAGASRVPKRFRLVSWNIDCLNPANKAARVEEVCAILLGVQENLLPDAILFQEVDDGFLSILKARLGIGGRYRHFPEREPSTRRYYTAMFTRASTVTVERNSRSYFPGSQMGRDLSSVRCKFNGMPLLLLNSHLESEKSSADERKLQFSQTMQELLSFRDGPAIFAGDTNLREAEVKQEKLTKEAGDMWVLCGSDPDKRFTWDLLKNDNIVMEGFQPRARYDRAFLNPEAKQGAKSFALLGTERMAPPHSCFPSDHFGMDCVFEW